jgi:Protein of unknown function (DUF3108)
MGARGIAVWHMGVRRTSCLLLLTLLAPAAARARDALPFAPGEEVGFRITWAHLLAGRATVKVLAGTSGGTPAVRFVAEARSQGFFAWLLHYEVNDRTVATWEPSSGCSLAVEKNLHEGRVVRDQSVTFDRAQGVALVKDERMAEHRFPVGSCALDVLSALFVARIRGVPEQGDLALPVFDNGKHYELAVRFLGRETLDLPPPLGSRVSTLKVEPRLLEGTGLFVKKGQLQLWLTDDARRLPVRMRSRVPVGSVSADLETYRPGTYD